MVFTPVEEGHTGEVRNSFAKKENRNTTNNSHNDRQCTDSGVLADLIRRRTVVRSKWSATVAAPLKAGGEDYLTVGAPVRAAESTILQPL